MMNTSTSVDQHRTSDTTNVCSHDRDPDAVREMFSRISPRYDLANHLLSAGCDFLWRKRAAAIVARWNPPCVLDLASGSGDLALALQRKLPRSRITALDFSEEMLALAHSKGVRDTVVADALALPFAAQSFDAVTVAFGLRNMQDWAAALREMRRVLTSSGHLLVLDFSLPRSSGLRQLYRLYLHRVLPRLCSMITRDASAYEYLGASIETFPRGGAMCDLLNTNGFENAEAEPLTAGIVTIYTAAPAARP
jgi:demethylmenaquinone methyltransferase/2-methoxy-6-polyprenyl-1,4-benzoquinol methylase